MHDCKNILHEINVSTLHKEKISEFEDIVIETEMSCRFIPVTLYLDFLCYIFIGWIMYFSEIYILSEIKGISTSVSERNSLIPYISSNSCWFYRNFILTGRVPGTEQYLWLLDLLRLSLLGKGSHHLLKISWG